MLKKIGVSPEIVKKTVVALYEAEVNIVAHAYRGDISVDLEEDHIKIVLDDEGPGIPDIDKAMQKGYSTASQKVREMGFGAGMGNLEATCGALIGAGMIAGLKSEGNGTLKMTRTMIEKFKERCTATKCGDLKAVKDGKVVCPCEECVRNAVLIYGEVMGLE